MDYKTEAEPKAYADGVPVFCAHDKIVDVATPVSYTHLRAHET